MIICNGYISFKFKQGGGLDANGYPVAPSFTYGEDIPCQYMPATQRNVVVIGDEHYKQAAYTILIEEMPLPSEQLRLCDAFGHEVGQYSIIASENLSAVAETKISV